MADDRSLWLLLPRPVRDLPADLAAVAVFVVLTNLSVFLPVVKDTPVRVVFGLAFVLFLPGYAFIAALFPEEGESVVEDEDGWNEEDDDSLLSRDGGIDGIERVALSFGLSIAIVPLIGLVLNFTPWGIRLVPIIVTVSGFTLVAVGVAAVRRWELPEDERFSVPYETWLASGREELFNPETRLDKYLNVLLVLSVVIAVGSVTFAVAVPKEGEQFTEFYLLTENETGDYVAADYPTEFVRGESKPVVIGIGNQEHEVENYTVVVELQRVEVQNNSTTVLEERELRRFETGLPHNETWMTEYNVRPTMTGDRLRLAFLLYDGEAPAEPTVNNSYRELHLWVNVTSAQ
ncbi:DUF1616 domain-containing protein [Haladaptatus sp. GCM10025707]|uniref:DUF1616 domain-containing protein n=1 Tax=unclassified Haladaptatus TaxID=2622732 RepID=UPI0023E8F2D7|nr:DUF1616 domain-containing protein [Haladaptatus sp. QDMS2]